MKSFTYNGSDLSYCTKAQIDRWLNPEPLYHGKRTTLCHDEFQDAISGPINGLAARIKVYAEARLSEHGDGDIEIGVEDTGQYSDHYTLVVSLVRNRYETDTEVKARISLVTEFLATKEKAAAKRKEVAEAKKIEKLKAGLAKLTEAERAELLKG